MSGWKRRAGLDGLGDGAGLGHDLEAIAPVEQRDEALADDLVVVDHEQAQDGTRRGAFGSGHRGSISSWAPARGPTSRVPVPGMVSSSRRPPAAAARWRMLSSPWWPSRAAPRDRSRPRCRGSPGRARAVVASATRGPGWRGVAGDVAERLADQVQQLAAGLRREGRHDGRRRRDRSVSTSIVDDRRRSSIRAATPPTRSESSRPGRRPKMKPRISRIERWMASIARVDPGHRLAGRPASTSSATSSRDRPTAYSPWMTPSWRSRPMRSRSATTRRAARRSCSRAFSMAMPAWRANSSTRRWSRR